jgi:hypothetical protein
MVQVFAYRHQPIKGLYREFYSSLHHISRPDFIVTVTYQALSTLFVRVPFWILIYLPKYRRPRPSWSLKLCVMVCLSLLLTYPQTLCPGPSLIVIQNNLMKHFSHVGDM